MSRTAVVLLLFSGCLDIDPGQYLRDAGMAERVNEAPACVSRCQLPAPSCKNAVTRVTTRLRGCDETTCELQLTETMCSNGCDAETGACIGEPCAGVTCDEVRPTTCTSDGKLRMTVRPGVCGGAAECRYSTVDLECPGGCVDGVCQAAPCTGVQCTTPPAALCVDAMTRRTFTTPGVCNGATGCQYLGQDETCANGCSRGVCVTDVPTGGGSGATGGGSASTGGGTGVTGGGSEVTGGGSGVTGGGSASTGGGTAATGGGSSVDAGLSDAGSTDAGVCSGGPPPVGAVWHDVVTPAELPAVTLISLIDNDVRLYSTAGDGGVGAALQGARFATFIDGAGKTRDQMSPAPGDKWKVANSGLWHSTSGLTFTLVSTVQRTAVWGAASNAVWFVGPAGAATFYNGSTFAQRTTGTLADLLSLSGSSGSDVWAVGSGGTIVHFDGTSWVTVPSGVTTTLNAVWVASATDAWAVGDLGVVLRFNGTQWVRVPVPTVFNLTDVAGSAADNVWLVGSGGTRFHFDGTRLESVPAAPSINFLSVAVSATEVWVGDASGGVSRRAVVEWAPVPVHPGALYAAWYRSASDVWVGGVGGVRHFDGCQWSAPELTSMTVRAIKGTSATDVWAVGDSGKAARFDGVSWSMVTTPTTVTLNAVAPTSTSEVWVAGNSGTLLRWSGTSFSTVALALTESLVDLDAFAPNDVVLTAQTIRRRWNGVSWVQFGLTGLDIAQSTWGPSRAELWSVGIGATDYTAASYSDGATLTRFSLPTNGNYAVVTVWGQSSNDLWAAGFGLWHRTTDWVEVVLPSRKSINEIDGVTGVGAVAVTSAGEVLWYRQSAPVPPAAKNQ